MKKKSKLSKDAAIIETIREMLDLDIAVTDRLIAIDRFILLHKTDGSEEALEKAKNRFSDLAGE